MKHRFTAALERFSRAMLAPLTYLSAAGLLLAAGALLTSTALSGALPLLQWGPVRLMGRILYKCLSAVISNLSVLFCTGLAASLAKQEKHQAAFIALMSYFIYLTAGNVTLAELGLLAQPDGLTGLYGAGQTSVLGIQTVDTGVFGGVLLGLLTAHVYDHTCKKAHRGILGGVFSGERDKVQTHASIRKNFLEETCEALEAIDADDPVLMQEELGDVLMQVAFHAVIEEERGHFTFEDVCREVCEKLVFRHPNIFASSAAQNAGINGWDALKNKEKGRTTLADELNTVPATLPALMRAQKLQKRAVRCGVPEPEGTQAQQALQQAVDGWNAAQNADAAGELLFAAANSMRLAGVDAEEALTFASKRFCDACLQQEQRGIQADAPAPIEETK